MYSLLFNNEAFKGKQDRFPAFLSTVLNTFTYIILFDSPNSHY